MLATSGHCRAPPHESRSHGARMFRSAALALLLVALFAAAPGAAEFGGLSREDRLTRVYPDHPNADAIVLLDEGVVKGREFHRIKRIKILTERGFRTEILSFPIGMGIGSRDSRRTPYSSRTRGSGSRTSTRRASTNSGSRSSRFRESSRGVFSRFTTPRESGGSRAGTSRTTSQPSRAGTRSSAPTNPPNTTRVARG